MSMSEKRPRYVAQMYGEETDEGSMATRVFTVLYEDNRVEIMHDTGHIRLTDAQARSVFDHLSDIYKDSP